MAEEVNIDLTSTNSALDNFEEAKSDFKLNFDNNTLTNGITSEIDYFRIPYFQGLKEFVDPINEKNENYLVGARKYTSDLLDFQSSIVYTPGELPNFKGIGKAAGESGVTDPDGKTPPPDRGGDIDPNEEKPDDADPDAEDPDKPGDIDPHDDKPPDADPDAGDPEKPGDIDPNEEKPDDADPDAEDPGKTGDIDPNADKPTGADGDGGDTDTGRGIGRDRGSVLSAGVRGDGADTGNGIDSTFDEIKDAIDEDTAEKLLAELLANTDSISAAVAGTGTTAGLTQAIQGTDSNVKQSGLGIGALAAIIGTIAAGGAGVAGAIHGGGKTEDSVGSIADGNGHYNGQELTPGVQSMLGGIVSAASGCTMAELLSGTAGIACEHGMNSLATVMNLVNEAGVLSNEEFEFAMSGEPIEFYELSPYEKEQLYINLAAMVEKCGGVEAFVNSEEARQYIKDLGDTYPILKDLMNKSPEEICEALKGLLSDSPTLDGVPISKNARNFIIDLLQKLTGLNINELLNGRHLEELVKALLEVLAILKGFHILSKLSKEDLKKYIDDLMNGKFPELCGIDPLCVRTFKDYMMSYASNVVGCSYIELYTSEGRLAQLQACIKVYSEIKRGLGVIVKAKDIDTLEMLTRVYKGEAVNVGGYNVNGTLAFALKSLVNAFAKYKNATVEAILTDKSNLGIMKSYVEKLYKYALFQGMFATLHEHDIYTRINDMMKGLNFGLLGFNFLEIETIKKANEEYAQKNNLKVADMLKDISFAPIIREYLTNNDTFIRLMIIFDGLNDAAIQKLIANLMVAYDADFKYRLQNLIIYANKKRIMKLISNKDEDIISKLRLKTPEEIDKELLVINGTVGEEYFNDLAALYSGTKKKEGLSKEVSFLVKLFLLVSSVSQKLAVKDMLMNSDGKLLVKETINGIRFYPEKFADTKNFFDFDELSKFISYVIEGRYPDLLGYTGERYTKYTDVYYNVANAKGINVKDLLGNGTFCIDVAKYIENDANNPIIRIYVRELNEASTQRFMYNFVFNAIR